ncbi:MAG: VWA domain-containing protein [Myxococcales bacterium]|nr:VWA domain-containing protein [Myxococcales bacterium]
MAVLARALTGAPVRLRAARGVGGIRGGEMLIPERTCIAADAALNLDALRVQVVVLAGLLRLAPARAPTEATYEAALDALRLARVAVDMASVDLPGFRALHDRVMARVLAARIAAGTRAAGLEAALEDARRAAIAGGRPWLDAGVRERLVGARRGRNRSAPVAVWGEWIASIDAHPSRDVDGASAREGPPPSTEREAPAVAELRRADALERDVDVRDAPPSAPFERVETLDAYRGGHRDLDGADELDAHLEALEQVELGDLFRGGASAASVLAMDLDVGVDVADAGDADGRRRGIAYDEWDVRTGRYRKAWCTVHPADARVGDAIWARASLCTHRRLVRDLRRRLEAQRAGLRAARRQLDGEDVDLEAAIDEHVERRAGRGGSLRVYVRQQRRRRDIATLVLLDVSMSTDSWVGGRRILDVGREAALVLGEVATQLGDRLQIHAFASETRNRCHVWRVLGDGEEWSTGKRRLAALEPTGYTRVGPAIRHATRMLASVPAEKRLLLLVSDAKPTDYDRYEGRYGVADVRRAIHEARSRGIHAHALAVDRVAREALPSLFGAGGFHILPHPDGLIEALTSVYGRLTAT